MREKIKCLNGPMEGTDAHVDRRLHVLYDQVVVEDTEDGNRYLYMIMNNGLTFVRNLKNG